MISVNRNALLESLEPFKALLKKQSDMDECSGQITYCGNRFWCIAGDYKMSSHAPESLADLTSFSVSGDLLTFLQKTNTEEIELELGETLTVKAKRSKVELSLQKPYSFEVPETWNQLLNITEFINAFGRVSKVTSHNFARPALTAVRVTDSKMEASDGLRYLRVECGTALNCESVLIPSAAGSFITVIGPDRYCVEDNQLLLQNEKGLIGCCPLLGGTFPDIAKKLNSDGHKVVFAKTIIDALDRCLVFTARSRFEEEKILNCSFVNGRMKMSAESPVGNIKEVVKAEYPEELEGRKFIVNPEFFKEGLTHSLEILLTESNIQVKSPTSHYICMLKG